jgi:hypothetical protein
MCDFDQYLADRKIEAGFEDRILRSEAIIQGHQVASTRSEYVIPVVVHVVYKEMEDNISDLNIESQLSQLNTYYNYKLTLPDEVPQDFLTSISTVGFRFQLACMDPDGNPTNGITRTSTDFDKIGSRKTLGKGNVYYSDLGGADPWPQEAYLNIWVAQMDDGLIGRSSFPIVGMLDPEDGIVIDPDNFGGFNLKNDNKTLRMGKTLAHEIGHYFGLYHPWGSGSGSCNVDDEVEDTPLQALAYYGCPRQEEAFSCGSLDMLHNMMAYVDDPCLLYFTRGQVDRMISSLVELRPGLLHSSALSNCIQQTPSESQVRVVYSAYDNQLFIDLQAQFESSFKMTIFDISGKIIYSFQHPQTYLAQISTAAWLKGVYILKIESDQLQITRSLVLY